MRWLSPLVVAIDDVQWLDPASSEALAYAAQLPERKFLLVTTRRSAVPDHVPSNVTMAPLAAYAPESSVSQQETNELLQAWYVCLGKLTAEVELLRHAADAGFFDYFRPHLRIGLLLREAWTEVLTQEPVKSVLCGDDLNYHTRLPLILAKHPELTPFQLNSVLYLTASNVGDHT